MSAKYGDIWLRDTGPLVVHGPEAREARRFGFNGWGGKYLMPGDETVGAELAEDAGLPLRLPAAGADREAALWQDIRRLAKAL